MLKSNLFLLLIATTTIGSTIAAFLVSPTRRFAKKTALNYRDNDANDNKFRRVKQRGLTIPIIGPIPNGRPLLVGSEFMLEKPTPLQWLALQESVYIHKQQNATNIDAAPLVAIVDDVSGKSRDEGRYATLAAVVGISSCNEKKKIDTTDESSFMESISKLNSHGQQQLEPLHSKIRLVGVGRALLQEYFQQMPTRNENDNDEDDDEYSDDIDMDDDDDNVPIVMAEFKMLLDSNRRTDASESFLGRKGAPSRYQSPVHAVAAASSAANRLEYLHQDRQRLVSGLKAAKARLEYLSQEEALVDHDGLGQLFGNDVWETKEQQQDDQVTIDEFLEKFSSSDDDEECVIESENRCASLDNFGLGYYSALATLNELTSARLGQLKPYYSKKTRDTEEFELQIKSFVAFGSLEGYCASEDVAWALQCTNSMERMERAYDLMQQHKTELEQLAREFTCKLQECGEECTHLW